MQVSFKPKDEPNWLEIEKVSVNMAWMLDMGYPEPVYWLRFGKWNDETQKEVIFNKKPAVLGCDYDFMSVILIEFLQKKQAIDSRNFFDDTYFSLFCFPNTWNMPLMLFNLGAYNFFEEDSWDRSNGGIAIVFESQWEELERFTWELQTAELQAMVGLLDTLRKAVEHSTLNTLFAHYDIFLQRNLGVMANWDKMPKPKLQSIELWRSGTYRNVFSKATRERIWEVQKEHVKRIDSLESYECNKRPKN